jgi:hypothetical protein
MNLFSIPFSEPIDNVPGTIQTEITDLQCNSGLKEKYNVRHATSHINPFRTKGHICPMFLKCFQIWLRQSRVLNFIHTDSVCYWLYVNKPGCNTYSLASLPDWQELSLEIPSINRKFDFLYKNNDVTKQKIDIHLAFICAYQKFLMLLMPHLFFSFWKILFLCHGTHTSLWSVTEWEFTLVCAIHILIHTNSIAANMGAVIASFGKCTGIHDCGVATRWLS